MSTDFSKLNADEILDAVQESQTGLGNPGFCLACGEQVEGFEPDARKCECECCGKMEVYGAEELMMMGACG